MSMQIDMEYGRKALIVRLTGELDHHTADSVKLKMEESLEKGTASHIVLNLRGLDFMDSSGIGVILGRYKQITAKGGKMVICNASPAVHRLFEMSGLFKIMTVVDTEKEAIASLEVVSK